MWLVRQGKMRFALPITTGTRPGVADYLPAPHGLPGFAAPVEQVVPALVPFLELADRRDDRRDRRRGRHRRLARRPLASRARGSRWARIGGKATEWVEPPITAEVEWRLERDGLVRTERLTATSPVRIARWRVLDPIDRHRR